MSKGLPTEDWPPMILTGMSSGYEWRDVAIWVSARDRDPEEDGLYWCKTQTWVLGVMHNESKEAVRFSAGEWAQTWDEEHGKEWRDITHWLDG